MGDTLSETCSSSCWAKDELEYVDERQLIKQQSFYKKDPLDILDGDEPISAAVSLVVSSARNGVIALCASVAHILREKKKLQERVMSLEKQILAVEGNSSGIPSVNGSCSEHCQAADLHSFQESPVSQRCGSAPAGFIASGIKSLKIGSHHDQNFMQVDSPKHANKENECCRTKEGVLGDCRTSRHSMPETSSTLLTRVDMDKKEAFNRGPRQTSTRSLDISQSLPLSSFVRRKYSTISLRRVRRSPTTRQKTGSTCSSASINSNASSVFTEQPKCNGSSSCVVTVAEVHTSPSQQVLTENSESKAVKLLARALTNALQGDVFEQERCHNSSSEETSDSQNSKTLSHSELCLPHPLAGCECVLCLSLAADPNCHLFALTTEGGTLLPPGSRVLIEGERVGTVLYLGHDKYSASSQCSLYCGDSESYRPHEEYARPVGVTVKLWAPDQGEVFVPLNEVICQLDEDVDIQRKESLSNSEYEYLYVDGVDDYVFSNQDDLLEANTMPRDQAECRTQSAKEGTALFDQYFIRSPSVSSYNSEISQSLGDLSAYGLDCGEDELAFNIDMDIQNIPDAALSHARVFSCKNGNLLKMVDGNGSESGEVCYSDVTLLNRTFLCKAADENDFSRSDIRRDGSVSLCDTFDSAISLSFSRRLQHTEESSEPSSINGTGRESPHFGDTWDSGCSMGRGRCKSDSSGNYSDGEPENRLGSTFTKCLGDSLNAILEKHKIGGDIASENTIINVDKSDHDNNVKSYHIRKDVQLLPELLYKEKQFRYRINGNVPDESEV